MRGFYRPTGGYVPDMGLFEVVKELLGGVDTDTSQPSVAEITIISTDALSSPSETPSGSASR